MKAIILALLLLSQTSLAKETKKTPSLGNCTEYMDYYIYKCQAFKCKLPVAKLVRTTLEMEVIGKEKDLCLYNYKYVIRDPRIPPTEIKNKCSLSQRGQLEMANQFTNYKKGDISVYATPPSNETLNKECHRY